MSDALLVALLGAVFNAGLTVGMVRAWISRTIRNEKETARAHGRIDGILLERRK